MSIFFVCNIIFQGKGLKNMMVGVLNNIGVKEILSIKVMQSQKKKLEKNTFEIKTD